MSNVIQTLRERELLQDVTDPSLEKMLVENKVSVYVGFDPSADSLHVGHMIGVMILKHFQLAGHRPIAVVGGGTGMVGDPSGRSAERNLLTREQIEVNKAGLRKVLSRFIDFGSGGAIMVDNADWLASFGFLDFLRDVGKYFRIGDMLAKDSVKRRLASENGLSFTEFSYMLLQAYDFLHLYRNYDCRVQAGGSDQWGNITAGTELIRRVLNGQGYGITTPLLMNAQGQKMGKTADGAVWLSADKLSPYKFYQFWIQQEDASLEGLFKKLTLLPLDEIARILKAHAQDPSLRQGQKHLAMSITELVHGREEMLKAQVASNALFAGKISTAKDSELAFLFSEIPSVTIPRADLDQGIAPADLLARAGLASSKSEARRLLEQKGFYLNNSDIPYDTSQKSITSADLASETMMILRAGKKKYCLVRFV
ncbi:tyrosine--tRNA ligase [Candidatus Sumerlaeota bacterium]|nr:tyrosine--tRNA ligase [Candidatus Sumerlaeota bacterium]